MSSLVCCLCSNRDVKIGKTVLQAGKYEECGSTVVRAETHKKTCCFPPGLWKGSINCQCPWGSYSAHFLGHKHLQFDRLTGRLKYG